MSVPDVALSTMVAKARRAPGCTNGSAGALLEEHVAQAEGGRLLVFLRSTRLELERIGAGYLRRQLESDLRSRRLVGASEEHGDSNHSHQDREDDPDRRNLHFLRAERARSRLPDLHRIRAEVPWTPGAKARLVRLDAVDVRGCGGRGLATRGAVGRRPAAHRPHRDESRRSEALTRGEEAGIVEQQGRQYRGSDSRSVRSARSRRGSVHKRSSRRSPRRRPRGSASRSNAFGSEGNGPSGARARLGARSPSTGDWCSLHSRCSTTWSCTRSATCASRITHDGSGHSSSDSDRAGATSVTGCAFTGRSFWRSLRTTAKPRLPLHTRDRGAEGAGCSVPVVQGAVSLQRIDIDRFTPQPRQARRRCRGCPR